MLTPQKIEELKNRFIANCSNYSSMIGQLTENDCDNISRFWVSNLQAELLSQHEEDVKKIREALIEADKTKWDDAVHCTCLGYVIATLPELKINE